MHALMHIQYRVFVAVEYSPGPAPQLTHKPDEFSTVDLTNKKKRFDALIEKLHGVADTCSGQFKSELKQELIKAIQALELTKANL